MIQCGAYILAGGKSRRWGSDKARAVDEGLANIQHIARAMRELGLRVHAIARNRGQYDDLGVPTIADAHPGEGPVAGVLCALKHCRELVGDAHALTLIAACDMVRPSAHSFATLLLGAQQDHHVTHYEGVPQQPFPACYSCSAFKRVEEIFGQGCRSMRDLNRMLVAGRIALPDGYSCIPHANTIAEADAIRSTHKPQQTWKRTDSCITSGECSVL